MTSERRSQCLNAIRGYVRRFIPSGSFKDDCETLLASLDNEVADGIAVRKEIATLLGLTSDNHGREELSAWFALPNIRAAIERMKKTINELDAQVQEAYGEIPGDQKTEPPRPFKIGDRCLYNLRPGFENPLEIPVKVVNITPKRIRIKDIGQYGLTRNVMAKSLRIDPNPSPEE